MVERTPAERSAAEHPTGFEGAGLAPDALPIKVGPQLRNTAEREITPEHEPDGIRLGRVHDQLAVLHLIAERDGPAHPHALASRGRELVPDALARDFSLELGKRQKDIEGESPH